MIDAAWQLRMEDKIGSLEVDRYVDIVFLEQDLFEAEVDRISKIEVEMTMMDGRFTYNRKE